MMWAPNVDGSPKVLRPNQTRSATTFSRVSKRLIRGRVLYSIVNSTAPIRTDEALPLSLTFSHRACQQHPFGRAVRSAPLAGRLMPATMLQRYRPSHPYSVRANIGDCSWYCRSQFCVWAWRLRPHPGTWTWIRGLIWSSVGFAICFL